MKERVTVQGRSWVINAIMVALNLSGLAFMFMGYHDNFIDQSTLFKFLGLILLLASIGGLVVLKGRLMMASVSRVIVGGLFIVSGLVKANDPIGFSYKLEEYFEDGALAYRIKELFGAPGFSMEVFMDYALLLSVIICIAEIVLGVLTILGGKIKLVSYLMLFMMLFFTFLTWHTASCDNEVKFLDHDSYSMADPGDNAIALLKLDEVKRIENEAKEAKKKGEEYTKEMWMVSQTESEVVIAELKAPQCVDDCGCFGDAMKGSVGRSLTPKESLWKDIIVLYLVFWIFLAQWIIKPNTRKENLVYTGASMVVIIFFSWVFGWYFPIWFGLTSILAALWILRVGKKYLGNYYGSALIVTIICLLMETYVLMYVPLKDYRPYAEGSNLIEKMNDGIEGQYENVMIYENSKTSETKEFTEAEYMESKIWEDTDWVFKDRIQKTIIASVNATIMDFRPNIQISELSDVERSLPFIQEFLDTSSVRLLKIYDKNYDSYMEIPFEEYSEEGFPAEEYQITDTVTSIDPNITDIEIQQGIVASEKIVLLITKKINEANWSSIDRIKQLQKACLDKDIPFIMICNGTREELNEFRDKNIFQVPIFIMDEIELKIVSRSNPALLVIENGVVISKYAQRSIPTKEAFKTKHLN